MNKILITLLIISATIFSLGMSGNMKVRDDINKMNSGKSMNTEEATIAGGCFWCTEADIEKLDGVIEAISGYTGGHKKNPSYEEVSSGQTGHVEAVLVRYDPSIITYEDLLAAYWRHMDPTDRKSVV